MTATTGAEIALLRRARRQDMRRQPFGIGAAMLGVRPSGTENA
jgi:hypothetical protein